MSNLSPLNRKVHRDHPDNYLTSDIAALVRRELSVVKRWKKKGYITPCKVVKYGKTKVDLYDEDGLRRAKDLANILRPGPHSPEQQEELEALLSEDQTEATAGQE